MSTKTATRPDKLQAAHERLTQAVEAIVSGDDWKRMLEKADLERSSLTLSVRFRSGSSFARSLDH